MRIKKKDKIIRRKEESQKAKSKWKVTANILLLLAKLNFWKTLKLLVFSQKIKISLVFPNVINLWNLFGFNFYFISFYVSEILDSFHENRDFLGFNLYLFITDFLSNNLFNLAILFNIPRPPPPPSLPAPTPAFLCVVVEYEVIKFLLKS